MTGCLVFNSHSRSRLIDSRNILMDAARVSAHCSTSTSRSINDCVIGISDLVLANASSRNHCKRAIAGRLHPATAAFQDSLLRCRLPESNTVTRAEQREDSSPFPPQRPRLHPPRSLARLARCSDANRATSWRIRQPESGARHAATPATHLLWPASAGIAVSPRLAPPQSPAPAPGPACEFRPAASRHIPDTVWETWDPFQIEIRRSRQPARKHPLPGSTGRMLRLCAAPAHRTVPPPLPLQPRRLPPAPVHPPPTLDPALSCAAR